MNDDFLAVKEIPLYGGPFGGTEATLPFYPPNGEIVLFRHNRDTGRIDKLTYVIESNSSNMFAHVKRDNT